MTAGEDGETSHIVDGAASAHSASSTTVIEAQGVELQRIAPSAEAGAAEERLERLHRNTETPLALPIQRLGSCSHAEPRLCAAAAAASPRRFVPTWAGVAGRSASSAHRGTFETGLLHEHTRDSGVSIRDASTPPRRPQFSPYEN